MLEKTVLRDIIPIKTVEVSLVDLFKQILLAHSIGRYWNYISLATTYELNQLTSKKLTEKMI